jgi:hypothetical protein
MIVNLTSFAVVREREVGTLEQIMVTPIRPLEFIIGKTIPFFFVGLAMTALIAVAGTLWFQIPFVGNPFVLLLGTSLYLLSVLGIGLLISTVCFTQQQAFATNFFVVNPVFIFWGFSFPIASMPPLMQWLSTINPNDLLSRHHSRDVPQGRWTDSAVATDAGARGARPYFAWPERAQIPQIARLTAVASLRCVWIGRARLSWSADIATIRELFRRKRECIPA